MHESLLRGSLVLVSCNQKYKQKNFSSLHPLVDSLYCNIVCLIVEFKEAGNKSKMYLNIVNFTKRIL